MLISLKNRLAILSMTKTGSTSLEQSIAPYCDISFSGDPRAKHMQLRRFERFIRPYLLAIGQDQVETFCFFRHPIDWLSSWYRYRGRDEIKGSANSTANMSFDQFVEAYLSDNPPQFARIGRQSNFVANKDHEMGVDHLFKFEHFSQGCVFLGQRFGISLDPPRLNVSPTRTSALSPEIQRMAEDLLARDFEIHDTMAQ